MIGLLDASFSGQPAQLPFKQLNFISSTLPIIIRMFIMGSTASGCQL